MLSTTPATTIKINELVARLITQTIQAERFEDIHTAFFVSQLVVESEFLSFLIEPWAPEQIVHQQLYSLPFFGNTEIGDEQRFRARGWGRLVGRRHYKMFSSWYGIDCVSNPDAVLSPEVNYKSWLWLWSKRMGRQCAELAVTNFSSASEQFVGWPDRIKERQESYNRIFNSLCKEKEMNYGNT